MVKRWWVPAVLTACAAAFLLAGSALGGEEGVREIEKEISKLQKVLEKAKKEGNWDEFVKIQKELTDLYARLKKMHAGGGEKKEGKDPEMEEWIGNLKRRLGNLDRDGQVEALKRLIAELKERGDVDRARAAHRILEGLSGKGGDFDAELEKIERRMMELRREAEKAERDFDFERVDKIKAEMKKLEAYKKKLDKKYRKEAKQGGMGEAEREEHLRGLFKALMEAKNEGDREKMARIQREIQEIKRGDGKPRREKEGDWRGEALAILEEMMGRMRRWAEEAGREGDDGLKDHLEEGIAGLKNLWESIEGARGEEEVRHIAESLEKAVGEIRRDIGRMREEGKPKLVEYAEWTADRLWRVREIVGGAKGAGRELPGYRESAVGVTQEVVRRLAEWREAARAAGAVDRLRDLDAAIVNVKRFQLLIKEGREEDLSEKALPALEEGIHKMEGQVREAKEAGDPEKAEMLAWLVNHMHRMHDLLAQGQRRESPETRPWPGAEGQRRAMELVKDILNHLREWARQADEQGKEEGAREMAKGMREMEELLEALREARGPEAMEEIHRHLEEGIRGLRQEVGRARANEKPENIEKARWVLERLQAVRDTLGQNQPGPGTGRGPGGREGWGDRFRERAEQTRRQIEEMMKKAEALERAGEEEQAEAYRRRAEEMEKHLKEVMGREGGRGPGWGRGQEGPEFGQEVRRLMMELRRARQEGDQEKAKEIERRIAELREKMQGETRRPDREERAQGSETQKLREEIDELKKELKDLKKLLQKLLKEGKKD